VKVTRDSRDKETAEDFRGLSQYLHANAGPSPDTEPHLLSVGAIVKGPNCPTHPKRRQATYVANIPHYSLNVTPFDLHTASLNNP